MNVHFPIEEEAVPLREPGGKDSYLTERALELFQICAHVANWLLQCMFATWSVLTCAICHAIHHLCCETLYAEDLIVRRKNRRSSETLPNLRIMIAC